MSSIRRRILLPLTLVTGLSLLFAAWGIDRSVKSDLIEGLDRTLLVMAQGIASSIEMELDGELELELQGPDALKYKTSSKVVFYLIGLEEGQVWESSLDEPPYTAEKPTPEPRFEDRNIAGEAYRLVHFSLEVAPEMEEEDIEEWNEEHPGEPVPEPEPTWFAVTVGHALNEVNATVATLRARLVIGFGLLFVALLLVPLWVVSRALAPLRALSLQADEVEPETGRSRLDEEGVDREVAGLVVALNHALGRVHEAYERQKRFTADAAHELRTPLAAIRARCEVALRRRRAPEELRDEVEGLHAIACRMGDVVESLLMLSRLHPQELMEYVPEIDLYETCREAVELNLPAAQSSGVELHLRGGPTPMRGDATLLMECVSNLIENAIRFTPSGGEVTVQPNGTEVRVSDTGEGIASEHREKIFERFYRVDKARARTEGGAGLGLAIVREIARLHGAQVSVQSEPGRGSTFLLRFPSR